eukprot:6172529-Pleurochrysis_carterae.AAC.4
MQSLVAANIRGNCSCTVSTYRRNAACMASSTGRSSQTARSVPAAKLRMAYKGDLLAAAAARTRGSARGGEGVAAEE